MSLLDQLKPYAHWLLRGALSSVFLYHGIIKLPQIETISSMMSMPIPIIYVLAGIEILGALFILLGGYFQIDWATRLAGFFFSIVMVGAITTVHWGQWGFSATNIHPMGGMEFQITLLLLSLYFVIKGNYDLETF